ncbi:hypothetical protein P3T37_006984 [Kitasatospora sp. MAA4]|uniref:hypothetical protein n=1 Tax=Kitasatospora sp. MAA4 TaxID=3035093 RepID=UPI0024743AE6|nr:hypothetical protein [Kitasatospora sp. MAA4]MDH6137551.1 hypothetical protein [Kitasatospora sp. MAA4]
MSLSYAGYTPALGTVATVAYTKGATALTTAVQGTAAGQTLPPYSITTLQLKPASATGAGSPSPAAPPTAAAPVPSAALPVPSATGTVGSRAQSEAGAAVGRPAQGSAGAAPTAEPSGSSTAGGLAFTGMGAGVQYSAVGGLIAVAAGSVLVLRGRRRRGAHGK